MKNSDIVVLKRIQSERRNTISLFFLVDKKKFRNFESFSYEKPRLNRVFLIGK